MIRYTDPFLSTLPLRRMLNRMLEDLSYQQENQQQTQPEPEAQAIPVNVFQTEDQVVIVAPVPGASPDDIEVQVTSDSVRIRSDYRGPHQEEKNYLMREWSYGPYERTIQLSSGVDAERTNASYNNGVLVLNLPKRDVTRSHRIKLQAENSSRGVQQTRTGRESLQSEGEVSSSSGSQQPGGVPHPNQSQASGTGAASGSTHGNGSSGNAGSSSASGGESSASSRSRKKA